MHAYRPYLLVFLATLMAAAVFVVAFRPAEMTRTTERADLQGLIAALLRAYPVAPGVTAYVAWPGGSWSGAAGLADVATRRPMRSDDRMRLESVSKAWTATLLLQLAGEGKLSLDDTVSRWLPGLLPHGNRITGTNFQRARHAPGERNHQHASD